MLEEGGREGRREGGREGAGREGGSWEGGSWEGGSWDGGSWEEGREEGIVRHAVVLRHPLYGPPVGGTFKHQMPPCGFSPSLQ